MIFCLNHHSGLWISVKCLILLWPYFIYLSENVRGNGWPLRNEFTGWHSCIWEDNGDKTITNGICQLGICIHVSQDFWNNRVCISRQFVSFNQMEIRSSKWSVLKSDKWKILNYINYLWFQICKLTFDMIVVFSKNWGVSTIMVNGCVI